MPFFHVTLDPAQVGASLALMTDSEQAAALTAFCRELRTYCGSNFNMEMQLHMAASHLSAEDREVLAMLGTVRL